MHIKSTARSIISFTILLSLILGIAKWSRQSVKKSNLLHNNFQSRIEGLSVLFNSFIDYNKNSERDVDLKSLQVVGANKGQIVRSNKRSNKKLLEQQKRKKKVYQKMKFLSFGFENYWKSNEISNDCTKTKFLNEDAQNTYRKVALASFPGSGNTWLRHLLHVATGIWTSSLYFDPKLYKGGFIGEAVSCNSSLALGVKAHTLSDAEVLGCSFDDVVLLLRNPYEAILSEFNRKRGKSHVGLAKNADFDSKAWSNHVTSLSNQFFKTISKWLEFCRSKKSGRHRCLIINYKDMVENTPHEMEKVLVFMNISLKRINCISNGDRNLTSGSFHRTRNVFKSRNSTLDSNFPYCFLSEHAKNCLHKTIDGLSKILLGTKEEDKQIHEINRDLPLC